jgi:4-hydroxybenzoate polyprenyltransferase/phosphoserine phosphatase
LLKGSSPLRLSITTVRRRPALLQYRWADMEVVHRVDVLTPPPLYVDLDGTLIATDLLHESVVTYLRKNPLGAGKLITWLRSGKAALKCRLSETVVPDVATLPYRDDVLAFLREEKARGRVIVLATASHEKLAAAVAAHLGLFSDVIATCENDNCRGDRKRELIQAHCRESGGRYAYLGDSLADVPVWADADEAYAVPNGRRVQRMMSAHPRLRQQFGRRAARERWAGLIRAMRPHQWSKNLLVLAPLLLSHQIMDVARAGSVILAAFCFCLAASGVYLLNDLIDVESDRRHPVKRMRPIAAGIVSIRDALVLSGGLVVIAFYLAVAFMPPLFALLLVGYMALTTAYSGWLKRRLLVDVMCLALLYTARLGAGGIAADISLSPWLLALSLFLFTSLAFAKRYAEITIDGARDDGGVYSLQKSGRAYREVDVPMIEIAGVSTGMLAVLVLVLYVNSDAVIQQYSSPEFLWPIAVLLMYWVLRIWFVARRQELHHDPVVFAFSDRISRLVGALVVTFAVAAVLS